MAHHTNLRHSAMAAILFFPYKNNEALIQVSSTSKVFSRDDINYLAWMTQANIPSSLKLNFNILPPVYYGPTTDL